eukprot:TRINITY_DN65843_c0_g1_i1.p1 TRINITY_DN65843_c0_g1~~TRINITY_DN65843_c0_g1_i1.p1  ORF type:complete len:660 (-),score=165.09 TRINITY_DN65843_c0_g1_i1:66-2045(-)
MASRSTVPSVFALPIAIGVSSSSSSRSRTTYPRRCRFDLRDALQKTLLLSSTGTLIFAGSASLPSRRVSQRLALRCKRRVVERQSEQLVPRQQLGLSQADAAVTDFVPKISRFQSQVEDLREGELQEVLGSIQSIQGSDELKGVFSEVDELLYAIVEAIHGLRESALSCQQHELQTQMRSIDHNIDQWVGRLQSTGSLSVFPELERQEELLSTISEIHLLSFPVPKTHAEDVETCSELAEDMLKYTQASLQEATCLQMNGRLELYLSAPETQRSQALKLARTFLSQHFGVCEANLVTKSGREAVAHLFEVAAGLKSAVPGDMLVFAEVKACLERAERGGHGETLIKLLSAAVRVGKIVRTQTDICKGAVSFHAVAVELVTPRLLGRITELSACIVGDGQAAKLLLIHLTRQHPGIRAHVVGSCEKMARRVIEGAAAMHPAAGSAVAVAAEELPRLVAEGCCHAVFTAVQAEHAWSNSAVENALCRQPLVDYGCFVLVDASEPSLDCLDRCRKQGFSVYSAEEVHEAVSRNVVMREGEAAIAYQLVCQQVEDFQVWLCSQGARPYLTALQARAEEIRKRELQKQEKKLQGLKESEREAVNVMTKAIVAKLLLPVVENLRAEEDTTYDKRDKIFAVKDIFMLEKDESSDRKLPPPSATVTK